MSSQRDEAGQSSYQEHGVSSDPEPTPRLDARLDMGYVDVGEEVVTAVVNGGSATEGVNLYRP